MRWFNRLSIRDKVVVLIASGMMFISTLLIVVFYVSAAIEMKNNEKSNIHSIVGIISPTLTATVLFDDHEGMQEILSTVENNPSIERIYLHIDPQNNATSTTLPSDSSALLHPLVSDGKTIAVLEVIPNNFVTNQKLLYFFLITIGVLAIAIFISLTFARLLHSAISGPILHLSDVIRSVSRSGDYSMRAHVYYQDEVGYLAEYFNRMMNEVNHKEQFLEEQVRTRTKDIDEKNRQLSLIAYQDGLTGLNNRARFLDKIEELVEEHRPFSLLFLDLDKFKDVNDSLGHDAGDELLKAVALRIAAAVTPNDTVCRLGGDEFTVICCDRDAKQSYAVAEAIRKSILNPFEIRLTKVYVSVSIGFTHYPEHAGCGKELLRKADMAMYYSKNQGRNNISVYDESMEVEIKQRLEISNDFREALIGDQFMVHFQPIVDLQTGAWTKFESLIRWEHPSKGIIYPSDFIPHAESNGFISDLGYWVFFQAVRFAHRVFEVTGFWMPVTVNFSADQFNSPQFDLDKLLREFSLYDIPEGTIIIEITENMLMDVNPAVLEKIQAIKAVGIRLALDDFGTEYSSLSYLQKLDIDILKIDKSFVSKMASDKDSFTLCEAIVSMSHKLDLEVVAEGIENTTQEAMLKEMGCNYGQGYYYSKPCSTDYALAILKQMQISRQVQVPE
ncbi:EAL domain-containing protein [Thaumasiovibrio subtropicus]|uniref:EAL domain-containing protein n=1 Tax=Thaumasiovibrio subtropicus TaxID=1891207 RepID=UPI00131AB452|nr:EAL domain-containing protein [Thaumasiovibrio subtropicus]